METKEKVIDEKMLITELANAQSQILKYQGVVSTCQGLIKYLKKPVKKEDAQLP